MTVLVISILTKYVSSFFFFCPMFFFCFIHNNTYRYIILIVTGDNSYIKNVCRREQSIVLLKDRTLKCNTYLGRHCMNGSDLKFLLSNVIKELNRGFKPIKLLISFQVSVFEKWKDHITQCFFVLATKICKRNAKFYQSLQHLCVEKIRSQLKCDTLIPVTANDFHASYKIFLELEESDVDEYHKTDEYL